MLATPALPDPDRASLIQRLVPLALTNRTALDAVLARLLLSMRNSKLELPALLRSLEVPGDPAPASDWEKLVS